MLNIEKYKDDINDAINDCYVEDILCEINENIMGERPNVDCYSGSEMCENCQKNVMKWLLEEYKEPILTEKEKAYLKNVIEPKRNDVTIVVKSLVGKPNKYYTVNVYNKNSYNNGYEGRLLEFIVTEDMPFKNMELYKHYTLEELGL